jgi:putative ABC transport system permease protein
MFVVASVTSAGRIGSPREQLPWVMAAIAAGAVPVLALILGSGTVPFNGPGIIPIAGIVIGNTMTAATLTGRRAYDEIAGRFGTYEAGLAVGLTSPAAAYEVIQPTAKEALTPGLDQTRTVGLVTLPGAFIGVLLGGGTPLEAGAAQILVLIGLMAGQALTTAVLLRLVAAGRVVREDLADRYPR